jgi:hypothetical protein
MCSSPGGTKRGGGAIELRNFRKNMKIYLTKENREIQTSPSLGEMKSSLVKAIEVIESGLLELATGWSEENKEVRNGNI